jgi:hypothetical protein
VKKLLLLLIFLFAGSASGQWIWQQKPMLGQQIDRLHQLGDPIAFWPFNEGFGNIAQDLSGNNYGMDFVNSPVWSSGKFGSAILFDDASNEYLNLNSAILTGPPLTFAGWFKSNDDTDSQRLMGISDTNGNSTAMIQIRGDVAGDPIYMVTINSAGSFSLATTTTGFSANTWHFAVGVWAATNDIRIYIDGGNKGTDTTSISPSGLDNTTIGAIVRTDSSPAFGISGKISSAMLWNRVLSDSEIALLYREPFGVFEKDNIALLEAGIPAAGVVPTPYYYRGFIPLPFIFFTVYYLRRRKCAA